MPLYEYQCKKCKHKFEKIQKFSDRPVKKCPQCGGPVEKLLHAPGLQFKGAGWYVTDYAGKRPQGEHGPEKGTGEKASAEKDAKEAPAASKDKPAEKHEAKPKKPAGQKH